MMRGTSHASAGGWVSERLIEIQIPDGKGWLAAVFEAYFDEGDRNSGDFVVAGCLFSADHAKRLSKAWRRATGRRTFHATDAHSLRGAFEGFSRPQSDRLFGKLSELVSEHRSLVVAVHCDLNELTAIAPKGIKVRKLAYVICAVLCVGHVARWLARQRRPGLVSYHFDQGHIGEDPTSAVLERLIGHPVSREAFRFRNHAFLASRDSEALQSADLIAWEVGRALEKSSGGKRIRPRDSLIEIMGRRTKNAVLAELKGAALKNAVDMHEKAWQWLFGRARR